MTNFKTITNDEVFKLIRGGSLHKFSKEFGGTRENEVFTTNLLRTTYKNKIASLRNTNLKDFNFGDIIDQDGLLIIDEYNENLPVSDALESLNDIFLSTRELLSDINRRVSNIDYANNDINLVKDVMPKFENVLTNYLMPIINKAYTPNANNILGNIQENIQPNQINDIYFYQDDIDSLYRNGYFNNWSDRIINLFIEHFINCRKTLNDVFQYYINFILKTRNKHGQQVYATKLDLITNGRFKQEISYYQSLIDRVLELIINKLNTTRQVINYRRSRTTTYRRRIVN